MITSSHLARRVTGSMAHWAFYCPGCRHAHVLPVDSPSHPSWTFNGHVDRPTFSPSVKVSIGGMGSNEPEKTLCHCWVREGQIEFLADSSGHTLRGFHPLPMFPDLYVGID